FLSECTVNKSMTISAVCVLVLAALPLKGQQDKVHVLKATPRTIVWGYYDAKSKPGLKINSGDTVEVQTLLAGSAEILRSAFLPAAEIEQALLDVFNEVKDKGPGGHILTGPIYIEGAEPGDTLEVRIKDIKLALNYGFTGFIPKRGFLPEDFDRRRFRIIRLDEKRMVGHFAKGIHI